MEEGREKSVSGGAVAEIAMNSSFMLQHWSKKIDKGLTLSYASRSQFNPTLREVKAGTQDRELKTELLVIVCSITLNREITHSPGCSAGTMEVAF